jgi:outer membrane protein assembly factor BamB
MTKKYLLVQFFALVICTSAHIVQSQEIQSQQFIDHGVAAPVSRARGVVCAKDDKGQPTIFAWLTDYSKEKSVLAINANTGKTRQFNADFINTDFPFSIIISSKSKCFYTLYGNTFIEFSPKRMKFSFHAKVKGNAAMSMAEDKNGIIWAASWPKSNLMSYDPARKKITEYGAINNEPWKQYPRFLLCGDDGWVYIGIGKAASQIIAFNPKTKKLVHLIKSAERKKPGTGYIYLGKDGQIYGRHGRSKVWLIKNGEIVKIIDNIPKKATMLTGTQEYIQKELPGGKRIKELNIPDRWVDIYDSKTKKTKRITFNYKSEGSCIYSIIKADNKIYGSTGHPLRLYCFDPETNEFTNNGILSYTGHLNALTLLNGKIYGAQYGLGKLYCYNPTRPWKVRDKKDPNPKLLAQAYPQINRPHALISDGKHIIMTGTPRYGAAGGGLLIYSPETKKTKIITQKELIPEHSTISLIALPNGNLLGGTTIAAGTGGVQIAKKAELYEFNLKTKKVVFRKVLFPNSKNIYDLILGKKGFVYGITKESIFFVWDSINKKLIHQQNFKKIYGSPAGTQAPRVMAWGNNKSLYVLFRKKIVRINPKTFKHTKIGDPPVDIWAGIVIHKNRIYFTNTSHIWSFKIPSK